jgi:TonB family protein
MKCRFAGAVFLGLCAVQAGRADLTLRYTYTYKMGSFLPPQALDAMKQQLGNWMAEGTTLEIKGDRVYASMGRMFSVTDYAKGEITVVDPETKRYATVPLADYMTKMLAAQKLPPMPPDAQRIFDNMKLEVKSSKTGLTETIQGIRTEENMLAISMELTAGMQMRTEIHFWMAGVEELKRTPAMRELADWAGRAKGGLDPVEMMTKSLARMPGMGEKLRGPVQEMMKAGGGPVIRMRTATYMPAMASAVGGPDQPVTEVAMDLAELSAAPIADSRFQVPAGYQTAAMEDLLSALFPAAQAAPPGGPKAEIPRGETVRIQPAPTGEEAAAVRVGNRVSAPQILERQEPSYTEEARAARIQGTVLLHVVVRPDGTAGQIKVLRSLDVGLDQRAVEAVSRWKFKPGMKEGKPVFVEATIEVSFHLL